MFFTASSPRSSPRAMFILSAASTNSRISCFDFSPSLPASPASAFSCSRPVRVSISFRLSFRSLTSFFVLPVYFITSASASSISAKACTDCCTVLFSPVRAANKPWTETATPAALLKKSLNLEAFPFTASCSFCTF